MDFRLKDKLELNGINVDKGVEIFCGSDSLYLNALQDFFNDSDFKDFIRAYDLDFRLALSKSKNLITITDNLGLDNLSKLILELSNYLKNLKKNDELKDKIILEYNNLIDIIKQI